MQKPAPCAGTGFYDYCSRLSSLCLPVSSGCCSCSCSSLSLRRFSIFCSYSFAEYCPIWEVSECTYDYSGLEPLLIPVCSSLYAQEPIEVDHVSEPSHNLQKIPPVLKSIPSRRRSKFKPRRRSKLKPRSRSKFKPRSRSKFKPRS